MLGTRHRATGTRHPSLRLAALTVVLLGLAVLAVQVMGLAFVLAGLSPLAAGAVCAASLLGSRIDIPVARMRSRPAAVRFRTLAWAGTLYLIPVSEGGSIVVAVNLGGAVIPAAVSLYLAARTGMWLDAGMAVTAVAVTAHLLARPEPRLGIVLPPLLPALTAAAAAVLLHPAQGIGALAYIAGTMGTLVGADLTHLNAVRRMDGPKASIGGAGTFDGVFLSGVFAVLLAAVR
ncbi:putative membrane protein [Actinoplanes octamycinicus]|uniref:Putative membrane protein n=1 Tax=Actinoplanes octamycinicus TaxID=135948 RepID=A0A7W7MAB6_9ACTN|nr:DUF1614 domain-containing protein [Actinoplanes octamycinicus]MBB4742864.1 putative membrane protein [Actinoplanes octamycinicus]GIE58283.1 hypothetical protein Aoc01nite_36850 [Actinoplanes octamycinicus]